MANLGLTGEVVDVKAGYGRNYLIPRGLAVVANESNVLRYKEETRQRAHKIEQQRKDAEALSKRLEGLELTITMPVGEENRLFGTVTNQMVADHLKEKGYVLDRRKISFSEDIRVTGIYRATVKLLPELSSSVRVIVKGEGMEAPTEEGPSVPLEKEKPATVEVVEEVEEVAEETEDVSLEAEEGDEQVAS